MEPNATAEIIAVGNELLLGETVDTNTAYIAGALAAVGVRVGRASVVGDDPETLGDALRVARGRSRWVIVTGGLGPTRDDLTRDVVADVLGRPLRIDPVILTEIEARFERFGYKMPEANRSQAEVPEGARVVPNAYGTAPGLVIDDDGTTFFVLPGVPNEMHALLREAVIPEIAGQLPGRSPVVRSRTIRTTGIGESALAERIDDLVMESALQIAFLPHSGRVDVRITADEEGADGEAIDILAGAIIERLDRWYYGDDDTRLSAAVVEALRKRGWTVAVAESCTGGGLGAALTDTPGASDVFLGGVVAYANEVKIAELGVHQAALEAHGAVSEEVCREMAIGVRSRIGADVGSSITGVAGPGGGTEEKPVGLVYCGVATGDGCRVRKISYPGSRATIRERAVQTALTLLLHTARDSSSDEGSS